MSFIFDKIEVSDWLLVQPLNIPKQEDASSCEIDATLNIWFLLQLGDTYNQVDTVNSRIWFAIQILNMSREQDWIKELDLEHRGITSRLKLNKKDIDTGMHIFINKMSPFNSLKKLLSQEKKDSWYTIWKMIDNSLRSQDDSGSSYQDESTEFDTEEKIDTAKSNEIIQSTQNSQEFIRDLERGKDITFNRYSDRFKSLKHEAGETTLADVATIESNRPTYVNLREYYVMRFRSLLETVTKKVDSYLFTVQVKGLYLITIKGTLMQMWKSANIFVFT